MSELRLNRLKLVYLREGVGTPYVIVYLPA